MKKEIRIDKAVPWIHLNPIEGHIEAHVEDHQITAYVNFRHENEWKNFPPGTIINAEIWIERSEKFEIMPPETLFGFSQVRGVTWRITGKIAEMEGEILKLESVLNMSVDLDMGPLWVDAIVEQLKPGDIIMVEGVLKADIHPD